MYPQGLLAHTGGRPLNRCPFGSRPEIDELGLIHGNGEAARPTMSANSDPNGARSWSASALLTALPESLALTATPKRDIASANVGRAVAIRCSSLM